MPIVRMPNGDLVRFPDEMSSEQIRSILQSKFPELSTESKSSDSPIPSAGEAAFGLLKTASDVGNAVVDAFGGGDEPPSGVTGLIGNVWTGSKQAGRMVGAAGNTVTNDRADVEQYAADSKKSAEENTPLEQRKLQEELGAIDREQGAIGQVGDVLTAAGRNKMGTAQMIAEQAPNSAVVLGTGYAGAKAGAIAGATIGSVVPVVGTAAGGAVGGIVGFLGGMFLGNALLETGGKAIEKAEGGFTEPERIEALKEGVVKGGVITAVDAATLKLGGIAAKSLASAANKAGARAEAKVLMDAGVDMTSPVTLDAALKASPELFKTAQEAGIKAASDAMKTANKAAIAGTGLAMETVGEGVGEYLGETAATGKGDVVDATIEALSSFSQSAAETAYNYNKAGQYERTGADVVTASGLIGQPQPRPTPDDILNASSTDEAIQKFTETLDTDAVDQFVTDNIPADELLADEVAPTVMPEAPVSQSPDIFAQIDSEPDTATRDDMLQFAANRIADDSQLSGILDRLPDPSQSEPYVGNTSRIAHAVLNNPSASEATKQRASEIYSVATRPIASAEQSAGIWNQPGGTQPTPLDYDAWTAEQGIPKSDVAEAQWFEASKAYHALQPTGAPNVSPTTAPENPELAAGATDGRSDLAAGDDPVRVPRNDSAGDTTGAGLAGQAGTGDATAVPVRTGAEDAVTSQEVAAIQDVPTTDKMAAAIAAVGEEEFARQTQAKIAKYRPTTPDQEAMLVEATAIEVMAKSSRAGQQPAQSAEIPQKSELSSVNADTRAATEIERVRASSKYGQPVLNLGETRTGWKSITKKDGGNRLLEVTLVSEDGKQAKTFKVENTASGTEALRIQAQAQGWAIDNPYTMETPQGELEVKPVFTPAKPAETASNNLAQRIKQLGGVDIKAMRDITGEASQKNISQKGLFREGGLGIDDLATQLAAEGFPINTNDVDGGVQSLRDLIAEAATGSVVLNYQAQEDAKAEEARKEQNDNIRRRAKALGLTTVGKKMDALERMVIAAEEAQAKRLEAMDDWTMQAYSALVSANEAEFGAENAARLIEAANTGTDNLAVIYGRMVKYVIAKRKSDGQRTEATDGQADTGAEEAGAGSSGAPIGDQRNEEGFALEAQTNEQLVQQEAALRAEEARKQDEERKAQSEAERNNVRQLSEGAAAGFQLGQSAEDNLTGQQDIFSQPPAAESSSAQAAASEPDAAENTQTALDSMASFKIDFGALGVIGFAPFNEPRIPDGHKLLSSKVIVRNSPIPARFREGSKLPSKVYAWRVSAVQNQEGGVYSFIETMGDNSSRSRNESGEIYAHFDKLDSYATDALERIAPPIQKAAIKVYTDAVAAQSSGDIFAAQEEAGNVKQDDVVTISGNEVAHSAVTGKTLRDRIIDWAKGKWLNKNATVTNKSNKQEIIVSWQGVKHAISGANEAELRLLAGVEDLIANAEYVGFEKDKKGRADIKAVHNYKVKAKLGDETLDVGIVVRETLDGHKYYDQFILPKQNPTGISEAASASGEKLDVQPTVGLENNIPQQDEQSKQSAKAAIKSSDLDPAAKLKALEALNTGALSPEDVRDVVGSGKQEVGAMWDAMTPSQRFTTLDKWAGAGQTDMGQRYKDRQWASFNIGEQRTIKSILQPGNKSEVPNMAPTDYAAQPYTMAAHDDVMNRVTEGEIGVDEFKAAFDGLVKNKDEILASLSAMTKPQIFKRSPGLEYRYKSEKKERVVDAAYRGMLDDFVLGDSISYSMGQKYEDVIRGYVNKATDETLAEYAEKVKARRAERETQRAAKVEGMQDPQTLDDFNNLARAKMAELGEGTTFKQARMAMTPEQRAKYDELAAEKTRGERKARKSETQSSVQVAAHTTTGDIIETKHTKTGEPLFVVKAAERVERDVYAQWNSTAKRLGGWYSSFRGNGAVPGFQFKTRENADAFLKYLGGDVESAKEAVQTRRDSYADDRSQSAVERLTEMAEALDEKAESILGADRKVNTARRARFAASAEASANHDKAMAQTMRNIAQGIENGTAKMLDQVRQKVQVEMLQGMVTTAQNDMQREKYSTYAEQERHKGEKPTQEVADYATFPTYTAYRSDLASLGRTLLETEGTKKLGQRMMKVADDVTDAYLAFANENLHKVSSFKLKDGSMAVFPSKAAAENSIAASGYRGAAIVLPFKRGQNMIVLSPSEAIKRGIWEGDNDKRITLSNEFGAELVEALGKASRRGAKVSVPWQFENAHDKLKRLAGMGIETPAELRAALREFIGLRQAAAAPDKVKELERAMIGRRNDGLDFFPTPAAVADEMIEAAGIEEGVSVLEPSAGMGHIADRIREAGAEPDVVELSGDRRELLEAKGYNLVGSDFMDMDLRGFTFGDTFRAPDGKEGIMRGLGGMGSGRVRLVDDNGDALGYYNRDELEEVRKNGSSSGYDRILMNPPFGDRRDALHVQHAYDLLKPGGRLVAIMGEGVFFGSDKKAQEFRDWLESVGGTDEKLEQGTFLDPSLPVNTGVSARMVVIDKESGPMMSRTTSETTNSTPESIAQALRSNPVTAKYADTLMKRGEQGKRGGVVIAKDIEELPALFKEKTGEELGGDVLQSVSGYNVEQSLIDLLGEIHPDVDAYVSMKADTITLHELQMPKAIRGEGIGSRFMGVLTQYADANGKTIVLTAAGDFGGNRSGQERFYKRFGFVSNKGANKDYRINENMLRKPAEKGNQDIRYSKNGSVQALYSPKHGLTFMVANHLNDTTAAPVLAHEITHASDTPEMRKQAMAMIEARDSKLQSTKMRAFLKSVQGRMESAGVAGNEVEAPAYIVEQALLMGRQDGFSAIDNTLFGHLTKMLGNKLSDFVRNWIASVRAALLKRGVAIKLTVDDMVALAKAGMKQAAEGDVNDTGDVQSFSTNQSAESFARMVLEEFAAENDKAFSIPTTTSKTVRGAIEDVVKGAEYKGEVTQDDEKGQSGADHVYLFKAKSGDEFRVSETDDGRVWIDVSQFLKGGGGQEVYSAVADYAFNTGKKFIGDPYGLTMDSIIRRTVNMLTSAIKHGTTKHIEAAQQQEWGKPEEGVVPLDWSGSDVDKVDALIHTFLATMQNLAPEIKEYRYDFNTEQFVDGTGTPVTGDDIAERIGRTLRANGQPRIRAGEKTARRAVFLQSLVSAARKGDGERNAILETVLRWGDGSRPENTDRLFSRRAGEDVDPGDRGSKPQRPLDLQGGEPGNPASWDSPEPSKLDDFIYTLQDKHIDMKRVVQAVKDAGGKLIEKFNPYLAEELFHGRAAKRTHDFVNTELRPMLAEMRMRGMDVDGLDQYLHARHAKEANALIAQRDPDMPDGGSGMIDAEADAYIGGLSPEQKAGFEKVAAKVDAIIKDTRDLYVSYGLISKDQADSWAEMFQHYVPLMREDNDGAMGIGQGFSIKGKEVKHRTGSKAKVVDILANIALQREKVITRGEKNRVAVALAGLVKLNPNPEFWSFGKPPVERVLNEKTGLVEDRIDPTFKSRPNVVVAKIKDSSGQVHERAIIFNEDNERAVRMAESFKNLDHIQLGGVMGVSAMITRYFASINTQYNPVFGIVNITRDIQGMALNLSSTPIAKRRADVVKLVPSAVKGIYQDMRSERNGKAANSKWAQLWEELQDEGGMTGYRDLYRNSEDRANEIKHELNPTRWHDSALGKVFTANGMLKVPMSVAQEKAGWLFDWLSDYNQTLEGATRLATYKVALDNGMSKREAASLAKNITVNFNRKGHIGQQAGAMYAFFNAAVQGTARIAQTMLTYQDGKVGLTKAGKTIVYGGILMGAMQAIALAAAGFDDDEPPEFVRERALIIPMGGKKYITIPMPLGFHVFPNLGRVPTEWAIGGFKDTGKRMTDLVGIVIEAFNPIGSAGVSLQTIMPTALDPAIALAENRDWTGKPIYQEDYNSMKPTPGFERNKDTATAWSKGIAEALNLMSGGTDYTPGAISPTADQIDFLIGQVTGGVGREIGKIAQTGESAITGEVLPPHKVPVMGRFYGDAENQSSQGNAYYSNLKRIFQVEAEIKGRRDDKLPIDEYKKDNPEWRLITRARYADRIIHKLKKQKRELVEKGADREKIRAIEERITAEMKRLNDAARKMEEKVGA